jgi:hypothetical protein
VGVRSCHPEMAALEHQEGPEEAQVCRWVEQPDWRGHREGVQRVTEVVLRGRFHSDERRTMEDGPGLRSGEEDNAPTGEHRKGEPDQIVTSSGSDARNERKAMKDEARSINKRDGPYGRALHPQIRRHYFWPEIAPKIRSTT